MYVNPAAESCHKKKKTFVRKLSTVRKWSSCTCDDMYTKLRIKSGPYRGRSYRDLVVTEF